MNTLTQQALNVQPKKKIYSDNRSDFANPAVKSIERAIYRSLSNRYRPNRDEFLEKYTPIYGYKPVIRPKFSNHTTPVPLGVNTKYTSSSWKESLMYNKLQELRRVRYKLRDEARRLYYIDSKKN